LEIIFATAYRMNLTARSVGVVHWQIPDSRLQRRSASFARKRHPSTEVLESGMLEAVAVQ
jgi:hypothetical protein